MVGVQVEPARNDAPARSLRSAAVQAFIASSYELTVLPPTAARVIQLAQDPRCTLYKLATMVKTDPGVAGRVLSLANSVMYCRSSSGPVGSLEKAISRIGIQTLKSIVMQLAISSNVRLAPGLEPVFKQVIRHGVFAAVACRAVASAAHLDPEVGFMIGLLHDVGRIVGLQAYGQQSAASKASLGFDRDGIGALLDVTHEEIGGYVARTWRLPPVVEMSIAHHHELDDMHRAHRFPLIARLGDLLAHQCDPSPEHAEVDIRTLPELRLLGLDGHSAEALIAGVPERALELLPALG